MKIRRFTLIEVMIVITIILILVSVVAGAIIRASGTDITEENCKVRKTAIQANGKMIRFEDIVSYKIRENGKVKITFRQDWSEYGGNEALNLLSEFSSTDFEEKYEAWRNKDEKQEGL